MLRVLQRSSRMVAPAARNFSSEAGNNKLVITEVDDKTGYATVTLNRPPVNSLSLELLRAISQTLDDLQNNKSRGMILTSVRNSLIPFAYAMIMLFMRFYVDLFVSFTVVQHRVQRWFGHHGDVQTEPGTIERLLVHPSRCVVQAVRITISNCGCY